MRRSRGSIWTSSRERQITSNLMKPSQKGPACQTRELQNGTSTDKDCIQVHYSRYSKIVQSSTDIANKILISLLDKHFKNFEMLAEALDASCVLSLVDGANAIPRATTSNSSGYSAKSIVSVEDPDGLYHNVVIDEDDCYRYYAEKLFAFNFMITMINLHILQVPIKEKDPIKINQMILNYFKGNKHHHVERARTLLAQHHLSNGDIVRDLSHSKLLISNLAHAQGSDLTEMQKFGILRDLMKNEQ